MYNVVHAQPKRPPQKKQKNDPMVAPAPAVSEHQKAVALESGQAYTAAEAILKTAQKEKNAIIKRLRAMYFMVEHYMSFMTYEPLMALINDVGGFGADCPQGTEAASYHNAGNGLKSRVSCRCRCRCRYCYCRCRCCCCRHRHCHCRHRCRCCRCRHRYFLV